MNQRNDYNKKKEKIEENRKHSEYNETIKRARGQNKNQVPSNGDIKTQRD